MIVEVTAFVSVRDKVSRIGCCTLSSFQKLFEVVVLGLQFQRRFLSVLLSNFSVSYRSSDGWEELGPLGLKSQSSYRLMESRAEVGRAALRSEGH